MYVEPGKPLRRGQDHEKNVRAQHELVALNFDLGTSGPYGNGVDGIFGELTEKAVIKFQNIFEPNKKNKGEIDMETGAILNEQYALFLEAKYDIEIYPPDDHDPDERPGGKPDDKPDDEPDDKPDDEDDITGNPDGSKDESGGVSGGQNDGSPNDDSPGEEEVDEDTANRRPAGIGTRPPDDGNLEDEDRKRLRGYAEEWKSREDLCKNNVLACFKAYYWVWDFGKHRPLGSGKPLKDALKIGGGTLEPAFTVAKLIGMIAQESSFGTGLGPADSYVGPFQLGETAVADFNQFNPGKGKNGSDVRWREDVDGNDDLELSARVAAWYLGDLLQQLTYRRDDLGLSGISDPNEANKFALAAYNGGLTNIQQARKNAKENKEEPGDPNKWDDVRKNLPRGMSENKKDEVWEYVENVREYERLAHDLDCV